jgi:hypothetical protein
VTKHCLLFFVRNVKERYQRRAFTAVGVVIQSRRRRERSISQNANCVAMETVLVLLMSKGCAVFAESLMRMNQSENQTQVINFKCEMSVKIQTRSVAGSIGDFFII